MRQVAHRLSDGRVTVVETPSPALRPGSLLIDNRFSLLSAGTERSKVELAGKSMLHKARARPDLVRKTLDRARVEGVRSAFETARERLDALAPIGYASAGVVRRVGVGVEGLAPGDRVACAGGGSANHAEVIAVPRNLVAGVPEGVSLEAAAYATIGAIALHGVRRAGATIGERVGVIGLGLVGQLAVRILRVAGCETLGVDLADSAVELASAAGARAFARDRPGLESAVRAASDGLGLDAVLVCADTGSPDPLELAARLARDRGRLVVVGDVPVEVDRGLLYDKELELRLSRSYGPGRYDREYEERGRDLPPGYVRWTEQRNLQAFLELVRAGGLDPTDLTTHRYGVEQAPEAYAALIGSSEPRPFGILLEYPEGRPAPAPAPAAVRPRRTAARARIGLIGAGSFARRTLIPALKAAGAELGAVATGGGLSAADVAGRFGFERAADSADEVIEDDGLDAVVIATRHSSHASLTAQALRSGRAVFVEKPLALAPDELEEVEGALASGGVMMVGFNRRFAPLFTRLQAELPEAAARVTLARVNAGPLPEDHWLHDPVEGGGRLIGEGCHFVDLLLEVAVGEPVSAYAAASPQPGRPLECSDDVCATLRFAGGGVGTLVYSGAGDPRLPKERIEVYAGGTAVVLEDFRRLEVFREGRRAVVRRRRDKGHARQIAQFVEAVAGKAPPPPVEGYLTTTRATLALAESLRRGGPVELSEPVA